MKTCPECSREFTPSSRHLKCPACRSQKYYKTCTCGNKMHKGSTVCVDCHVSPTGELNPNWRGGTTYHKAGYLMCRFEQKYIFEHVLVMEEYLGRKLVKGENVHHINGIKDDNRIENLELWCKPQPTGIRAEDAYEHALKVIELYKDYSPPRSIDV